MNPFEWLGNFFADYWTKFLAGLEFMMALGSIIGVIGLIIGLGGAIFSNPMRRDKFYVTILASVVLVAVCGLYTGFKYFRVFR
jgi:hypothetical protein